jgi:Tol biopolymer transport system component
MIPMRRTRLTSLLVLIAAAGCRGDEPEMAFVSERGGTHEIRLLTRSGDDRPLASAGAGAGLFPIAFAPKDPSLLAVRVVERPTGPEEQLMIVPMAGGNPRPIGPLAARARNASWSPDGKWIAFESSAQSFRDIYRMTADGKHVRRLTDNREGNFEPEVSPDGKWIAFVSSRDGDAELYVIPARGGPARRLTAFHRDDWSPRWSPDGSRIAFLSNRGNSDRIYVIKADGSAITRLTDRTDAQLSPDEQEMDPAWSPDGREIAYTFRTRDGRSAIRIADAATGKWRSISDGKGKDWMPAWSPDGRQIAFSSERGGDTDLYRMTADGKKVTRLTTARGADWLPRWVR